MSTGALRNDSSFPTICIVGAGMSGLCAAIQLKKRLGITSFTIFDTNLDVGGTWLVNKYPGCACDVPSHMYSFSFELNPDWPENCSSSDDIQKYMRKLTEKYDLYPSIKFRTQIKSLEWDETIQKWRVTIANLDNEESVPETRLFDIVVNGPGALRIPNYPEEYMSFKGPIMHSAEWDSSIDLENKVVALIGSGASAVQIVPAISDKVKELHVYQRKPAWVLPANQFNFSNLVKFIFAYVPFAMFLYRLYIFLSWEKLYPLFKPKSYFHNWGTKTTLKYISDELGGDEQLIKDLTPNYPLGCKRLGISDGYYKCFTQSHVKIHRNKIVNVSGNTIHTENGDAIKADVLILATGFKVQDFLAPITIIGKQKENVLDTWKKSLPSALFGIITHAAPNHFILLGPNTLLGNNSVVFMLECQVNYMVSVIKEMMRTKSKCVTAKLQAEKEYMQALKKKMKTMIWSTGQCGAWYANADGEVTALWPYLCSQYWWRTRKVNFSQLEFS